MHRRGFLSASGAVAACLLCSTAPSSLAQRRQAAADRVLPFDFDVLKASAARLGATPYQPHGRALPADVAALSWDQYQAIRFNDSQRLWADEPLAFRAGLFHLGLYFKRPVRIFEVADRRAREFPYSSALFDYGSSGLRGMRQPKDLGFAGFRLHWRQDNFRSDVAAFLGASYFRAVGRQGQYGLSARGLAVDTALPGNEEFPDFTDFYLERPAPGSDTLTVYALLDSPSVAGAYRFLITPGEPLVMDVEAALYPRRAIERVGIAPCTSMYQVGENDRRMAGDWRPEIHDSDGLAMHTGSGEWIWRPLTNPSTLTTNAFEDRSPKGFGLLQRDRNFDHYQDDGVFYERRPSLWVQPVGDWGHGAVHLVQIPTQDETLDNIVAFWTPAEPLPPGKQALFRYRLSWGDAPAAQPEAAICVATRTGIGGVVGQKRSYYATRFAVDFAGGSLARLDWRQPVEPVITISHGRAELTSARPVAAVQGARVMFDVVPDDTVQPITLRLFLRQGDRTLSETWLYEWMPPPLSERKF